MHSTRYNFAQQLPKTFPHTAVRITGQDIILLNSCLRYNFVQQLPKTFPHTAVRITGQDIILLSSCLKFYFFRTGICNGLVLWTDWILNEEDDIRISTGPSEEVTVGKTVTWDVYSKQGVYFFKSKTNVTSSNYLSYSIKFHVKEGSFEYSFKIL